MGCGRSKSVDPFVAPVAPPVEDDLERLERRRRRAEKRRAKPLPSNNEISAMVTTRINKQFEEHPGGAMSRSRGSGGKKQRSTWEPKPSSAKGQPIVNYDEE